MRRVSVGLYISPPFVMTGMGQDGVAVPQGMAVDLWRLMAERLGVASDYRYYSSYRDLVAASGRGEIDIAVSNITITRERAELVDFTHPWYDAGMRIMVSDGPGTGFRAIVRGLDAAGHLRVYAWLLGFVGLATVLMTLFDRRFDKEFPERWPEGIAESFYSVMSVATSGKAPTRRNVFGWPGRIFAAFWLVCGIAVVAYLTSSVTSVMTTLAISQPIAGPEDLPGRRVGVLTGSVHEDYARLMRLNSVRFDKLDAAVAALSAGRVDAIIGDSPVLEYYVHRNPTQAVNIVGKIFEPDKYGFALPVDSPYTRDLTIELLRYQEDGTTERVRSRYFGDDW